MQTCLSYKKIAVIFLLLFICGCSNHIFIPRVHGDCVDRAIAIRQSLRKQGHYAEIMIGTVDYKWGHAWVVYRDKDSGEWKTVENMEEIGGDY